MIRYLIVSLEQHYFSLKVCWGAGAGGWVSIKTQQTSLFVAKFFDRYSFRVISFYIHLSQLCAVCVVVLLLFTLYNGRGARDRTYTIV